MKTYLLRTFLLTLLVFIFWGNFSYAEAQTVLDSHVESDLHLTKDGSPYTVLDGNNLYVSSGHTLTIDPGVTLFLNTGWLYIDQTHLKIGNINSMEKVIIDVVPGAREWSGIYINKGEADINNLEIKGARSPLINWYGTTTAHNMYIDASKQKNAFTGIHSTKGFLNISSSTLTMFQNAGVYADSTYGKITDSIISKNRTGVFYSGESASEFSGSHNSFIDNTYNIFNINEQTSLDFRGNDWGTGGAPKVGSIVGKVIIDDEKGPLECCSNVVFIPGIQGSRLFKESNQLWEPNVNADVEKLYLNEKGESIDPEVTVGEIIDKTNVLGPIASQKIYQSFIEKMDALVAEGNIKSWKALPYDWRLDLFKTVTKILPDIEKMASSSPTSKVSLVTHSNGGLVAKVLINSLKAKGKEKIIDKLIMVAAPQLGTPQAILSLLHGEGTELGKGIILNSENARTWGENMQAAYNLIPSASYFDILKKFPITFNDSLDKINSWKEIYGDTINTEEELKKFLLGEEGRIKPDSSDLATPNILNEFLFEQAKNTHNNLSQFTLGSSTKTYQIAGWGKSTPIGIEYSTAKHCGFENFFCIGNSGLGLDHRTLTTIDGDGTVVTPSAAALSDSKTSYFVDIKGINDMLEKNYNHASLFEVPSVLDMITNLVQNNTTTSVAYISKEKPNTSSFSNLEISVHSPVDIHAYDAKGNHTGPVNSSDLQTGFQFFEESIPNSAYKKVGEGKYLSFDGLGDFEKPLIKLQGTAVGTFTLEIKKSEGEDSITTEFIDIPVTDHTKAELLFSSGTSSVVLALDFDGNNTTDFKLTPSVEPHPELYLQALKHTIPFFNLDSNTEKNIITKIDKMLKSLTKEKQKMLIQKITHFGNQLQNKNWKIKTIPENARAELIKMINDTLDAV